MSSEWKNTTIGECLQLSNGKSRPTDGGSLNVFGSNGIIGSCQEENSPAGTIIIGRVGTYCGSLHFSDKRCWVTDNAIQALPRNGFDGRFFFNLLKTCDLARLRAGSGQPLLNQTIVGGIEISVPPYPQQKSIAHILGTLDDKIELNRKTNETLEGIAKALFKSWFVDFDPVRAKAEGRPTGLPGEMSELFPDSFEGSELGEIPSGWSLAPLDNVANYLNGLALQKFPPKGDHTDLPVIKIAQLRKGDSVDSGKCSNELDVEYVIKDGDILFSWSGSLLVDVWVGGTGVLNQHLFKVTSQDFEKWFYYWWTKHYLEEFQAIAQSKATTMGHIQRKHLSEALVVVPPEEVLEWMNKIFSPILNRQIQGRLESRTLTSLRDTLLPRLISGELRVPDAEKMLEEVGV